MAGQVEFRVLGPLEVRVNGSAVSIGPKKAQSLLAVLLLRSGETVPVDDLIDALWGPTPPASAPHSIHVYISQLRRAMETGGATSLLLVTRPGGYALELRDATLDLRRFQSALEAANQARRSGDASTAADEYRRALALWRGPPLVDLDLQGHARNDAARLEDLWLTATIGRIEADLESGQAGLVSELEALIERHPANELLRGQLMTALYREGRQAEALALYRATRETLVDEFGIEPGRELQDLHKAILRHDHALRAPHPAATAPSKRHRRRLLGAALTAAAVATSTATYALVRDGSVSAPAPAAPDTLIAIDPHDDIVAARYAVGGGPVAIAAENGNVWSANLDSRTLSRLDLASGRVTTIGLGYAPTGIAATAKDVWVTAELADRVLRIDPATVEVTKSIQVRGGPAGIATTNDRVWLGAAIADQAVTMDVESGRLLTRLHVPAEPSSPVADGDGVWIARRLSTDLVRLDAGGHTSRVSLRTAPFDIARGFGALWVSSRTADVVYRVDPTSHSVVDTIRVGDGPTGIAAGGGAIWVANSLDGTVSRIDPRNDRVVSTIPVGHSPVDVVVAHGRVFAAVHGFGFGVGANTPRHVRGKLTGGTLRLATQMEELAGLDPQREYNSTSWAWEVFRCCLLRTLLSYSGTPTGKGGGVLQPDLALSLPHVSRDGLIWTFRLRGGLHYAPPFERRTIQARDFIRALRREARNQHAGFGNTATYYSVIEGFDDFAAGRTSSITGLEAPNPTTLVIRVRAPTADLGDRLTLPAAAPIPATPPLGAPDGRWIAASGPYMYERTSGRPTGYVPHRRLVLVRNPSWWGETDRLRPAYVDRIEIDIGETAERSERQLRKGSLDFILDTNPTPQLLRTYESEPRLRARIFTDEGDLVSYGSLNVAAAPFDDVHVRRAANRVVDKQRWARILRTAPISTVGWPQVRPAGHIVPDGLEGNLLLGYDAYGMPPGQRLAAARREMALSPYDHNHDGHCDDLVCRDVVMLAPTAAHPAVTVALARLVAEELRPLGISIRIVSQPFPLALATASRPQSRIPFYLGGGWKKDYGNASTFFSSLFLNDQIDPRGGQNLSLVGATASQLRQWRYKVRAVPTLDTKIHECLGLTGFAQTICWAEADRRTMEEVVPAIPFVFLRSVRIVSPRVAAYSYDQFSNLPALDRIILRKP